MTTKTVKRCIINASCVISAAILCGAARAEEPVGKTDEAEKEPVAELEEEEDSVVSAEFTLKFDSKYLSYGFIDNNEPMITPGGSLTFFDWFYIGAEAKFDLTRWGRRAGYRDRAWKVREFHPNAGIAHDFSPEDYEWLPTTISLDVNYDYEYQPRCQRAENYIDEDGNIEKALKDTQYWTVTVGLPDLWCEPQFTFERDVMRDHGTYLNLELGHTFALVDGEGEDDDPVVTLRPSIAQGWGNAQRVRAYAYRQYGYSVYEEEDEEGEPVAYSEPNWQALDYAAFLDTVAKLELTWNITGNLSLSAYVAYSDFLLDEGVRDAAREYTYYSYGVNDWHESWNVIGGIAFTASF